MSFKKIDAGAGHASTSAKGKDCQVRALCHALNIKYPEAWLMLYVIQGKRRACNFTLVEELRDANALMNVVRQLDYPAQKGKRRMTATQFCKLKPRGNYILRMPHHVAAVIDGVVHDTWDSRRACVYTAWEIKPLAE